MHTSTEHHIYLGFITKPHGIRGELSVLSFADDPQLLKGSIFLTPPSGSPGEPLKPTDEAPSSQLTPSKVTQVRLHHGAVLIKLEGVTDRNIAESFRNRRIFIQRDKLPDEQDEFYIYDLLGIQIVALDADGTAQTLGTLEDIDAPAGQELWTIITEDGKEILFPAVQEFIGAIDFDTNTVTIFPPPGLIELYLAKDE